MENVIKPKTTVMGIGGAGIKIARALSGLKGSDWLNIGVADTNEAALNDSGIADAFSVGTEWTQGEGCGGDSARGARAFAHKTKKKIDSFISGSSMLILVGGLGGGSATGGIPVISRSARKLKIPTVCIVTTPFSLEGKLRRDIAEEGLRNLLPDADVVIPVPNDVLFTSLDADTPISAAFTESDKAVASAVLGLTEIMRCQNLISTDFADLKALLKGNKSLCYIGLGVADDTMDDRCAGAVEKLFDSPLLGGKRILKDADAMLITVIGGDDFNIGEMKQALDVLRNATGEDTRIVSGINTDSVYTGKIFITVVAIKYDESSMPAKKPAASASGRPVKPWSKSIIIPTEDAVPGGELVQPELAFQHTSRGYFTKASPTMYKGEDLDIPPFQRQGITLDKGAVI